MRIRQILIPLVLVCSVTWTLLGAATADDTGFSGGNDPISTVQRSLALTPLIRQFGIYPSGGNSPVGTLGELTWFAGNFVPDGYAAADGQLLSINQNTALFSVLGTTYGGNGTTTFALPDLRGRTMIGAGSGPGLTPRSVGDTVGTESLTLSVDNLAPHQHNVNTNPPSLTSIVGSGTPYTTMQPSLAVNYVVPLQGIYPSHDGGGNSPATDPVLGFVYATAQPNLGAPQGALPASGQILPINQHTAVFSLLGTTYGGNGTTTFAVPDLSGRAPIGVGQPPTAQGRDLGGVYGTETSTMSLAQMPDHDHTTPSIGGVSSFQGGSQPQDTSQPTLGLNYVIATSGIYPSRGGGSGSAAEPLLGQIELFAGNFDPAGWVSCDGRLLLIQQNTALFSLLGTTYGGNGTTTFALPDLRDALAVGAGQSSFSTWQLGEQRGADSITISEAQMPAHDHAFVPEPASFVLAGLGLLGLGFAAVRKKHRRV